MPLLCADTSVPLLNVNVPAAARHHPRNGRTRKRQVPDALWARGSSVPALAVSRNAHAVPESLRLTFVEPQALPPEIPGNVAAPRSLDHLAERLLLLPAVVGEKAAHVSF
jgi:hypothetical protein